MMLLKPVLQLGVAMATARLAAIQWWYTSFESFCAESEAHVCSDRGGPPWGNKVFPFADNMAALSYMKGTMHACTVHKCVCVCV